MWTLIGKGLPDCIISWVLVLDNELSKGPQDLPKEFKVEALKLIFKHLQEKKC